MAPMVSGTPWEIPKGPGKVPGVPEGPGPKRSWGLKGDPKCYGDSKRSGTPNKDHCLVDETYPFLKN